MSERESLSRTLQVLAVVVLAAALGGYFVGTRPRTPSVTEHATRTLEAGAYALAPTYAELGSDERGAIGERQRAAFRAMFGDRPALRDDFAQATPEQRAEALAERSGRRAYDGAPPRIPHAIGQMETRNCVDCHLEGVRVGGLLAPAMSHEAYTSCTQCHVVNDAPMPGAVDALRSGPPIDNTFVGLESAQHGVRAWEGAPPQIPHPTRMREQCATCHGVLAEGLRSTHPYRQSCTQCHAPSAAYDQRAGLGGPPMEGQAQ